VTHLTVGDGPGPAHAYLSTKIGDGRVGVMALPMPAAGRSMPAPSAVRPPS